MNKQWTLIISAAMVFSVSLPSGYAGQNRGRSAAASRTVQEPQLGNVEQLKEAFQNDAGMVRLVALLSPT